MNKPHYDLRDVIPKINDSDFASFRRHFHAALHKAASVDPDYVRDYLSLAPEYVLRIVQRGPDHLDEHAAPGLTLFGLELTDEARAHIDKRSAALSVRPGCRDEAVQRQMDVQLLEFMVRATEAYLKNPSAMILTFGMLDEDGRRLADSTLSERRALIRNRHLTLRCRRSLSDWVSPNGLPTELVLQ